MPSVKDAQASGNANTKVVLDCYDSFNKGDIDRLLSHLSEDIDWEVLGLDERVPTSGNRHGKSEVRRFFGEVMDNFDIAKFEVLRTVSEGDEVVVLGRWDTTVKPTSSRVAGQWAMSFLLRGGKIVQFREYSDTAAANAAFGLSPRTGQRVERRPGQRPS